MKTFLLSVGLLLFAGFCKAQVEFAPVGATWHFDGSGGLSSICEKFISASDTIVLGKPSRKLELERRGFSWIHGVLPVLYQTYFIHQDGSKIYRYNEPADSFFVFLDFSLEAGDTLHFPLSTMDWYYVVDSVGYVEYYGQTYKRQYGRFATLPWPAAADAVIIVNEKFGTENYHLFLDIPDYCAVDGGCYKFRCYEDNDFPLLKISTEDCDYVFTSSTQEIEKAKITLSPNPAVESLTIQFPQSGLSANASLKLFNLAGTLMKTAAIPPGTKELTLDISSLPPGLYLLVYEENGLVVQRERVVLQRD